MHSHQITPLFSVEGQRLAALHELKKQPGKMAVVIEQEQERTFRILYTFEIISLQEVTPGQEWSGPVGWTAKVRAVVFPWEIQEKTVKIINIYHEYNDNRA